MLRRIVIITPNHFLNEDDKWAVKDIKHDQILCYAVTQAEAERVMSLLEVGLLEIDKLYHIMQKELK